jgi:hypothetical protein
LLGSYIWATFNIKSIMEERIEQLKAQEAQLQMQLDEIRFLIQGYENTLKKNEEDTKKD